MTHQELIDMLLSHKHSIAEYETHIKELTTMLIRHENRINELSIKFDSLVVAPKKRESIAKTGDLKPKMTKSEAAKVRWDKERERKRIEAEQVETEKKPEEVVNTPKSPNRNGTCKVEFIMNRDLVFQRLMNYAPEFMAYLNTLEKDLALAKAYATVQKFEDTLYFPSDELREEARLKHQHNLARRIKQTGN